MTGSSPGWPQYQWDSCWTSLGSIVFSWIIGYYQVCQNSRNWSLEYLPLNQVSQWMETLERLKNILQRCPKYWKSGWSWKITRTVFLPDTWEVLFVKYLIALYYPISHTWYLYIYIYKWFSHWFNFHPR